MIAESKKQTIKDVIVNNGGTIIEELGLLKGFSALIPGEVVRDLQGYDYRDYVNYVEADDVVKTS